MVLKKAENKIDASLRGTSKRVYLALCKPRNRLRLDPALMRR